MSLLEITKLVTADLLHRNFCVL